jgi:predicted nuclease of predicted toxin-antitoxin system
MKFLVDECVGRLVALWLIEQGYDAVAVADTTPSVDDVDVLQKAFRENRILVTLDKDFGDLIFKDQQSHCGVVLLRLNNWHTHCKITVLSSVLAQYGHELDYNFIVATERSIRIIRINMWH